MQHAHKYAIGMRRSTCLHAYKYAIDASFHHLLCLFAIFVVRTCLDGTFSYVAGTSAADLHNLSANRFNVSSSVLRTNPFRHASQRCLCSFVLTVQRALYVYCLINVQYIYNNNICEYLCIHTLTQAHLNSYALIFYEHYE